MLKVDGELTRRNRLRVEVFSKFDSQEALNKKFQRQLARTSENQKTVLSTITKLSYVADI